VEARADRSDRDAQHLGDLGQVATLEMAENEQSSLLRSQASEAPLELISIGDVEEVVSGHGQIDRQGEKVRDPPAFSLGLGKAGANDEAVEPRVEPIRITESGQVTPGDHQRFLDGILGLIDVAEDPLGECEEAIATSADQVGVRASITLACSLDEVSVHRLHSRRRLLEASTSPYGCKSPRGIHSW